MRLQKKQHRYGCVINIAPLIDVVFLLIIFFMVVSQFTQKEIEAVVLPEAGQGELMGEKVDERIIVNVNRQGEMIVEEQAHSLRSLGGLLQAARRRSSGLAVVIRSDRRVHWETVRAIMKVCADLKLNRVRLAVAEVGQIEPTK